MGKDYLDDNSRIQLTKYASGNSGHRYQITTQDGFCTLSITDLFQLVLAGIRALNEEMGKIPPEWNGGNIERSAPGNA